MDYRPSLIFIDNGEMPEFPDFFSNEVYISKGKSPEYPTPVSYSSSYTLKCVVSGNEKYEVDGEVKTLDKGTILFIEPKSKVQFLTAEGLATSIFLDEKMLKQAHHQIIMGPKILDYPFDEPRDGNVPFYALKSYQNTHELRAIVSKVFSYKGEVDLNFYLELSEKIILAQNEEFLKKDRLGFKKKTTKFEIFKRLLIAKEYLEDNLSSNISLDELALVACLSKYHLIRTFKLVFGKSPGQYHIDLKVNRINHLLSSQTKIESLTQLALDFGFNEYSVFYKHYTNRFHKKPSIGLGKKKKFYFN